MLTGDWNKAAALAKNMTARFEAAKRRTLYRIGTYMEARLKKGITDQAPGGREYAALHPFTVKRKGSSKALIRHGDLRNSITHQVDRNSVFIGVLRTAKGKDGQALANIAAIHEEGAVIRITPKMRGYLWSQGMRLSPDTRYIVIPARPTFGPVLEAEQAAVLQIIADTMRKGMGL